MSKTINPIKTFLSKFHILSGLSSFILKCHKALQRTNLSLKMSSLNDYNHRYIPQLSSSCSLVGSAIFCCNFSLKFISFIIVYHFELVVNIFYLILLLSSRFHKFLKVYFLTKFNEKQNMLKI